MYADNVTSTVGEFSSFREAHRLRSFGAVLAKLTENKWCRSRDSNPDERWLGGF
jgi:hypothetical protein